MLALDKLRRYDGQEALSIPSKTVTMAGPAGNLEGVIDYPSRPQGPERVAVVCHPHPLYGGSLQNKVVHTISRACNTLGMAALRFNFRGVGASDGAYDHGLGETDDLLAVLDWLQGQAPQAQVWLAGFSFGAYVACRGANLRPQVARLISVAPPVNLFNFNVIAAPACPWWVIQGRRDEIVPCSDVEHWLQRHHQPAEAFYLDADHFFHGQLNALRDVLTTALAPQSPWQQRQAQ